MHVCIVSKEYTTLAGVLRKMNNKLYGRNSRATPKQFEKLLEIVSAPGILDLASGGHVAYRHLTKSEFWKQAASKLNSVPGGVYKNPFKWCKMWCDWKHNTKGKAKRSRIFKDEISPTFSHNELQLLKLLDIPVDSLDSNDGLEQMNGQHEFEVVDFVESDSGAKAAEVDDKSKIELNFPENNSEEEAGQEAQTINENKFKRRKLASPTNPPEQSESYEFERYKLRQRDEELRLRAIELKLKHEELKLKEAEMTKVNNLFNIEEEKLRCFQNIAGMLKELVDRTKNGHPPKL